MALPRTIASQIEEIDIPHSIPCWVCSNSLQMKPKPNWGHYFGYRITYMGHPRICHKACAVELAKEVGTSV